MPYIGKAPASGIRSRFIYTATAAQTTFTGADGNGKTLGYTDGEYVDVYLNGVLLDPADYTATSKTSVVLDSGATVSDIVEIVVYDTFSVFNGTFTGDVTVGGVLDATTATFDRASTDGTIIDLQKDGSTVGSIGSRGSGTSFITLKTTSGAGAGLTGSDNRILPMDESALADNNTDLGMSSYRFKDLYLGGNLYLGGTGSDNALDDYEEGTWTPTYFISGATFTMGLQVGTYVKIGRMVHATARVRGQRSGGSGVLLLTGLPFTTESTTNINAACSIGFTNGWSTSPKGAITGNNATSISFRKSGSTSALSNIVDDITHSDVSTASTSSNDLILSVTYRTS